MGDKNNNNFMFQPPSSNHPSLHNTQQGARFVLLSRNSLAKPRGSLASGTTGLLGKDFTTQTSSFESQYGGLVRPVNNGSSLLQTYMWDGHKLKAHVERIISVKPRVDCTAPHVDSYKVFNMQKTRDMSRRKQKLDAENKSLVDRVTRIMTNGRSDLDCWNPDFYKPSAAYYKKQARKKRERDNSFLLERIMSIPPSEDSRRVHLLDEYSEHVKIRNHMRRFPQLPTRRFKTYNSETAKKYARHST